MKRKRKQKESRKAAPKKRASVITLSRKKVWAFRVTCIILIPLLFFSILELGLRIGGYGFNPHAIIPYQLNDKEVNCHNYKFGWRFFPHSISRHFDGFVFDTQKAPPTYRIFVLGASAAAGIPAQPYSFGHVLEVMLDEMYPQTDFEVHTVAMPAINSHVVVEIAKDCARYQPDLFIVYLGNNEVVGPYGPGTVFTPFSPNLSMIRANIELKATRTGQLLEQVMQSITPRGRKQQEWGGLEMFLDKQVHHDDPALEVTYGHYEQNLKDICRIGFQSGAAVIVSNVASNLKDCPPFASLHNPDLTDAEKQSWQNLYDQGIALEKNTQYPQAIEKYLEAEAIDSTFAELQFRLARCYWNMKNYEVAKQKYIAARDYDTLRFRADSRINEIIRAVAADKEQENLYFVDSINAIDAASPQQVPGEELFYEHVHLNFNGNYILASTLLPSIQKTLPQSIRSEQPRVLNKKETAALIGYTDYERAVYLNLVYESFLSQPPFTNRLDNDLTLLKTKKMIDAQLLALKQQGLGECLRQHQAAVENRPQDWLLHFQYSAFLNSGMHDARAEETQLKKVIQLCPYSPAYVNLGINLNKQGRARESEVVMTDLLQINPNAVWAHIELASISRKRRDTQQEIYHLQQALLLEPEGLSSVHLDLAWAYENSGDSEKAFEVAENAIKVLPETETPDMHALLSYLLYKRGEHARALKEIQEAFRIDPSLKNNQSCATLYQNLTNTPPQ